MFSYLNFIRAFDYRSENWVASNFPLAGTPIREVLEDLVELRPGFVTI
jgi:hypothetical protein